MGAAWGLSPGSILAPPPQCQDAGNRAGPVRCHHGPTAQPGVSRVLGMQVPALS